MQEVVGSRLRNTVSSAHMPWLEDILSLAQEVYRHSDEWIAPPDTCHMRSMKAFSRTGLGWVVASLVGWGVIVLGGLKRLSANMWLACWGDGARAVYICQSAHVGWKLPLWPTF